MMAKRRVAFGKTFKIGDSDKKLDNKEDDLLPFERSENISDVPYHQQGDATMYTKENLAKRRALRTNNEIRHEIDRVWDSLDKTEEGNVSRETYINLFLFFCKELHPNATDKEWQNMVEDDFIRDTQGSDYITYEQFYQSLFELADLWTTDISGKSYAYLIRTLVNRTKPFASSINV